MSTAAAGAAAGAAGPSGAARRTGRAWVRRALLDAALVALAFAAYLPALRADFVFDDRLLVVDNEVIAEPIGEVLGPSVGARIAYRPLRVLSYMIDYRLAGGLDPFVFHLSNLAYHAATVLALHALARALLGATPGAWLAAALFAVHPLGSEAVAYVSGRRDLLCALFAVLSLRAWWWLLDVRRARRSGAAAALALTLVLAVASLAAKETALVLPVLAALLAVLHAKRPNPSFAAPAADADGDSRADASVAPRAAAGALVRAALLVGVAAVLLYPDRFVLAWYRLTLGPLAPQPALSLHVLGRYFTLAVWPATLLADYRHGAFPLPEAPLGARAAVVGLVLAAVVVGGVLLLRRGQVAGAGLLWFVAALLPVAQIVPYLEIVSEHNAYLPLAGLCLAAGAAVDGVAARRRTLVLAVAALVVAALGARTYVRSHDWRDEVTLWTATLEAAPGSLRAQYNLGVAFRRASRWAEAEQAFERAAGIDPRDVDSLVALAEVRGRRGDYRAAARTARRAIELSPTAPAWAVLGWSRLAGGAPFAARRAFRKALALDPGNADAIRGLRVVRDHVRPRTRIRTGDDEGPPRRRGRAPAE